MLPSNISLKGNPLAVAVLLTPFFFLWAVPFRADAEEIVKEVLIKGNVRVQDSSIRYYITNTQGKPYTTKKARDDIKKLYTLGYFDDIRIDLKRTPSGIILTYILKEKPFLSRIEITGADAVKKSDIEEKLTVKKGTHFKKSDIVNDLETIKKLYREKGYYLVKVTTESKTLPNNTILLKFNIDEGKKIHVESIYFYGNRNFSTKTLLSVLDTNTTGMFSWITESGTYKKDVLKTDILKLQNFYGNNGYIQFRVEDPRVEIDRETGKIHIGFFVHEGEQFKVGKLDIEGDEIYTKERIGKAIKMKSGDIFNRSLFAKDIFSVTELYLLKGFAYTDVRPKTKVDSSAKVVNIAIKINHGQKTYIGKINITGNSKTMDKVIRREFRLKEGGLFDSSQLARSRERLNRLGYFEKVEIKQKSRNEPDLVDLSVDVTETSTGSLSIGAGYSSVEKTMFFAQISQRNLFGTGKSLSLDANISSLKRTYSLSLSEPYLFDKEMSGGVSVFNTRSDVRSYTSTRQGGSLSLGKTLGEYSNIRARYQFNTIDTFVERDSDRESLSSIVKSGIGVWKTSSITLSVSRDTRNDFFNPSKGYKIALDGTLAGGPLSGRKFYRLNLDSSYYKKLYFNFIFMIHGKIGFAESYGGDVFPLFEHYFLGGSTTMRGFSFEEVGPLDDQGNSIGGNASLLFNTELQYPFTKFVRGFLFYDRGQVYGSEGNLERTTSSLYDLTKMRHSWGFGIKFFSPMGPISLAWGYKIDQKSGESSKEFHFDIGRAF